MTRHAMIVDPTFGATLRQLRCARGISLRQLATTAHSSRGQLGDIETGRRQPTPELAASLDTALNSGHTLANLVAPSTEHHDRIAYAARHPRRLDRATIDALSSMLAAQRQLEDSVGSAAVLPAVATQQRLVRRLVTETAGPVRRYIVDLGAQWAQYSGWLHTATGRLHLAKREYTTAIELSVESGNQDMVSTVLSYRGYLAEGRGEWKAMIGLSRAAQCDPSVFAGQRAYSAGQEARGLALAGAAVREVRGALAMAEEFAGQVTESRATPWGYYYTPSFLVIQRGIVWRHLADRDPRYAAPAIEHLASGLGESSGPRPEWSTPYLIHLGAALALVGDRTGAGVAWAEARQIADDSGSSVLRRRVEIAARECPQ